MALIEVEDGEYRRLKAERDSFAPSKALLDKLGSNPKTRGRVLELMKEANPDLVIPEIDAAKPFLDKLNSTQKELDDLKKQLADDAKASDERKRNAEVDGRIESGRALLRKLGYNDDGIKGVEKVMQERGLADYEAAEAFFERENKSDNAAPFVPGDYGRGSALFSPPEGNPWIAALRPRPAAGAQKAINDVTNSEINKFYAEIRPNRRARV
jgi:hypothetical protein